MIQEHFDWVVGDDMEFPNKWPTEAEVPNFRTAMKEFIRLCHHTGLRFLEAMDVGLELPSGILSARCENPVAEARPNYYAPISKASLAEDKAQRAWAHTDFGLITLLLQDEAGGLEMENREKPGTFIPIIREDTTEMAVYISDTMESLTNGFFRAVLHQVAFPVGMNDDKTGVLPERYSVASFIKANRDTSAGPTARFVDSNHPAKSEEMTAVHLHQKRAGQLYVD